MKEKEDLSARPNENRAEIDYFYKKRKPQLAPHPAEGLDYPPRFALFASYVFIACNIPLTAICNCRKFSDNNCTFSSRRFMSARAS